MRCPSEAKENQSIGKKGACKLMKSDVKIGTKLVRSMIVVIGIALVMGAASSWSVGAIRRQMDHLVNISTRRRMLARQLSMVAANMLAQERGIVLGAVLQQRDMVEQNQGEFQASSAQATELFG